MTRSAARRAAFGGTESSERATIPGLSRSSSSSTRAQAAEAFAAGLEKMWKGVGDRFGWRQLPQARIFELATADEY